MIDISDKIETLRSATAESRVIAKPETIEKAMRGETPKGEVIAVARAAAVLAAKKTSELIPYCHPLSLDHVDIQFEVQGDEGGFSSIIIKATVKSIGRTGVEMEALVAASIAALTIYDMVKGIDRAVTIGETRLIEKQGGKSDYEEKFLRPLRAAVLVTSDSVSSGKKSDKSGKLIIEEMKRFPVEVRHYEVVPDDGTKIREKIMNWSGDGIQLILTTGGTGLGPRDVTVDTIRNLLTREVPAISEAMHAYGQRRTPYAMLSRSVAGVLGKTLIITLPGSSRGVQESIRAIFPNVLHLFNMMEGGGH